MNSENNKNNPEKEKENTEGNKSNPENEKKSQKSRKKRRLRNRKNIAVTILLVALMAVGLCIMFYPVFSRWWNSHKQEDIIVDYDRDVETVTDERYKEMLEDAEKYNEKLAKLKNPLKQYKKLKGYESLLDISGIGVMGHIDISKIDVHLPIYHGTSDAVLNVGAGHLEGTSLPIGGPGTHAIITAHRGLPSSVLFSDLDQLIVGDRFTITVLSETLYYEVDQITVVKPGKLNKFSIEPGKDYVTLMTCTPYGINTHRLLVRGHRVSGYGNLSIPPDAVYIKYMHILAFMAIPAAVFLVFYWRIRDRRPSFPHYNPLLMLEDEKGKTKSKKPKQRETP